jgi:hypothetical protein
VTTIELTTGAEIAAFWACRDSAHRQVHHASVADRSHYSPTVLENLRLELVWTIQAVQALMPTYDVVAEMASRCWTRPEAEGGIVLCDAPLDEGTVRRIVDEARAFDAARQSAAVPA